MKESLIREALRQLDNDLRIEHDIVKREIEDKQREIGELFNRRERLQRMMSRSSAIRGQVAR